MASQGLHKQRRVEASRQFASREVRSFEVEHVNSCWHLDFHTGSRSVLTAKGTWVKPSALCILDDRSRLICHVQWFLDETARTLVHGFCQALMRRALPRSLLTDNGAAMMAEEFKNGLHTLGILHQTTLPYSPWQNGKQERVWGHLEGRLIAMLDGVNELTLDLLNNATHAWVEVFLPSLRWVGFDPTNNIMAGERHVPVAVGRDYNDVPPSKGVYKGEADSALTVAVAVGRARAAQIEPELLIRRGRPVAKDGLRRPADAAYREHQQQQQQQ